MPGRLGSRPSVAACHCPVKEFNCMESARYDVYASQSGNSYAARGLQIVTLCALTAGFGEFLGTKPVISCYFFRSACLPTAVLLAMVFKKGAKEGVGSGGGSGGGARRGGGRA